MVNIPLVLAKSSEVDEWFDLEKEKVKDTVSGKLHVNIKFIPSGGNDPADKVLLL
jgi:hypothetical protein